MKGIHVIASVFAVLLYFLYNSLTFLGFRSYVTIIGVSKVTIIDVIMQSDYARCNVSFQMQIYIQLSMIQGLFCRN